MEKKDPFESLRYPEFRNYIISRFFFILVLNMQATLISWKVYDLTKDPFSIGLIGLIEFVPAFFMAFYSGHVIDKSDKRNLLLRSVIGNAVLTGILCFFTTDLAINAISQTWLLLIIYFVVFGTGILRSFSGPTSFALVSHLVPRHTLANATLWHSGSWQVGAVTGPALAGLLYASIGITYTFYLMLLLMVVAAVGLMFIKPKPFAGERRQEKIIESIRQGFYFVWRTKEVLGALSLDLFAVLFGGATALLPVFADQILRVGPVGLGMLRSAPALGSVVVLVLLTFRPLRKNQGRLMLLCVAGFGVSIIVFGLSEIFWLSLLALFLSGILDGISVIVRSTILQLKTPDEMRGRVAALNSIFIMSSNELGAFESGMAARLLGTVPAVVFGGGMTLAVVVFTWLKAPTLRKLQY
ncbi:MAG TPA: MFS transporter [Chitinophagaceae bacterium]|nr:MFS transporter [Chitinophagaceae bacterium]